ncbi:hypothetical protein A2291_06065 [candidate division WOR-1 bacterium RIFOXYB2_FULL_42_35]|uniref:Uncharacterized protein n=1 Tax=candidate division WOR-1 bacterium RIFOXYC2_FULL_41_25 TaxID=1802586 RepID=A0A1F4TJK5_UNCSA|nr:MAG: hypothetical protein A2247_01725 [candidate division WOR-1 bacterium RIFOXYA2_FULL_41_14]OGC22289.1 MAG: hypothetical protein A2291_06065 [candidate division WOR-1 bacterium RIFOXYB2_FULL_42_35]OGC32908.1 MAG: hypothetical protein A2462_00740 [candidate division WOR-1 bacterium RIFOXYC2_FULL_41_25]OGC41716.1 MAG: hypothetical protein A2548_04980 [candidate division WOR-1 bacterium RIFOXYD2_FULL_41_8]
MKFGPEMADIYNREIFKERQMKLNDKIRDRKIAFLFRKTPAIAFELAMLHFVLAKRKQARKKVIDASSRSIYWLKKSGLTIPKHVQLLSPYGQLEEIEKILVHNKAKIDARLEAVPAKETWQLTADFGLA